MPAYALIAEPDPAQAQIYRHIALAEGFDPKLVRDGEQALSALRSLGAPGLTILEPSLALVDGFKVLEELRKLAPPERSPVVVISAFRELRDAALKLRDQLGIAALLARSSPVESVRRTIKKVLAASEGTRGPVPLSTQPSVPEALILEIDEERAEELRLQHLEELEIIDDVAAPQDEELHQIVADVAKKFGVPTAMISLVLEDKQFAKAHVGLGGALLENRGGPRDLSFCTHVVQGRQPLVVPDAAVHPAFANNPLVQQGVVRSYAGAPLETPEGHVLGSLCIIDTKPMTISSEDVDQLVILARLVAGELELRSSRKRQEREREHLSPEMQSEVKKSKPLASALGYLSAVLDTIDNGVFLVNEERKVVFTNQALADLFMTTRESMIGRHRDDLIREAAQMSADPDEFLRRLRTSDDGPYALKGEFEMERPRRRMLRWVAKPVQLGEGVGHVAVITDITADRELVHERENLARTDRVTGLMNRRGAEDVLEREAARAQRFGSRVSVALFDLDHFKQVNDRHGHVAGDGALHAVGQVLAAAMRGVDVASRWGGDELLGILPATGLEGARSFAERVRAQVEHLDPALMHGVTLSVGVAELQPGEDWADSVRRAAELLQDAKDAGRNRVA